MLLSPTVTVHIVTYNSAEDIEVCLNAVLRQTYELQKVIVIDNASVDGTAERVRNYIERTESRIIQLISNPSNTGFAPAHNQAIRMTESDYVLVLNPDVELGNGYVERLVREMERQPEIGSATGLLLFKDSPGTVDSTGLAMNGIWRAFDRGAGEPATAWKESGEAFGVSGAAALYRREMIREISHQGEFFDESFLPIKKMSTSPGGRGCSVGKRTIARMRRQPTPVAGKRAAAARSRCLYADTPILTAIR